MEKNRTFDDSFQQSSPIANVQHHYPQHPHPINASTDFINNERNNLLHTPPTHTSTDKNKNNESLSTKFDALKLDDSNDLSFLNDSTDTTVTITPNTTTTSGTTSDGTFYTDSNYSTDLNSFAIDQPFGNDSSLLLSPENSLNLTILNSSADTNSSDSSNISAEFDTIPKHITTLPVTMSDAPSAATVNTSSNGDANANDTASLDEIIIISSEGN